MAKKVDKLSKAVAVGELKIRELGEGDARAASHSGRRL